MLDSVRRCMGVLLASPLQKLWVTMAASVCFAAATPIPVYSLSFNQLPIPPRHDTRHTIDELEESWRSAILSSNATVLATLLSDDYMAITPSGTLQTKEDTLASLRSGRVHFVSLTISERKVRFYGSTAIVTSLVSVQATNTESPLAGNYRYTHVYARDAQGKWKIVNFEASRVRDPGSPHHKELH